MVPARCRLGARRGGVCRSCVILLMLSACTSVRLQNISRQTISSATAVSSWSGCQPKCSLESSCASDGQCARLSVPLDFLDTMLIFEETGVIGEGGQGRVRTFAQRPIAAAARDRMDAFCDQHADEAGGTASQSEYSDSDPEGHEEVGHEVSQMKGRYCTSSVPDTLLSTSSYLTWFNKRSQAVLDGTLLQEQMRLIFKDHLHEASDAFREVYFGLLTAHIPELSDITPRFAGYSCMYMGIFDDGFSEMEKICGKRRELAVLWLGDSVEVFNEDGLGERDELDGEERNTATHLAELAVTDEGRALLRNALRVSTNEEASQIIKEQAMSGLNRLHEAGIAHGDLFLKNMVCSRSGHIQFIDFGFSHIVERSFVQMDGFFDSVRRANGKKGEKRLSKFVKAVSVDEGSFQGLQRDDHMQLSRALSSLDALLSRVA